MITVVINISLGDKGCPIRGKCPVRHWLLYLVKYTLQINPVFGIQCYVYSAMKTSSVVYMPLKFGRHLAPPIFLDGSFMTRYYL